MRIKRLKIDKMPGFTRGLKEYQEFSGNINIIAGANGTGKSSTGRIIKKLIWWDKSPGVKADSDIVINDAIHKVKIEYSDYIHIEENNEISGNDLSYLVPSNYADRYTLALHDLVKEDDRSLAEEIVREVNGGIDLKRVAKDLGYNSNIYTANNQRYKEYFEADARYKKALSDEGVLREKLKRMDNLKRERDEAEKAHKEIQFYSAYRSCLEKYAKLEELLLRIKEYNNALDNMRSEDYDDVKRLDKSHEEKRNEIETLKREISSIEEQMRDLTLPENGVEDHILEELEQAGKLLSESESKMEGLVREINRQKILLNQSAAAIGIKESTLERAGLDLNKLSEIEALVRDANVLQEEYNLLLERRERLKIDIEETRSAVTIINPDYDKIKQGIASLSRWLQEGAGERGDMKRELWSVAGLGVVTAIATYLFSWFGLLGIVPIIIVTFILLSSIKKRAESNITILKEDYLKTGLEPLSFWSREEVLQRISFLLEQQELLSKLRDIKSEEKRTGDQIERYNERLQEQKDEIDRAVSGSGFMVESVGLGRDTFHYFVEKVEKWQSASAELKIIESELERLKRKESDIIADSNLIFAAHHCPQADSILSFNTILSSLKKQEDKRRRYILEKRHKSESLERDREILADIENSLNLIYSRLNLIDKDRGYLGKLSAQLEEYNDLKKEIEKLKSLSSEELQKLKTSELSDILSENLSIEEVKLREEKAEVLYKRYGDIIGEIEAIRAEMRQREGDDVLEKRINEREEALESLTLQFEENLASITGSLITDQLQKEISFNNDNKVFREANKILGNITHNRYSLILSDSQFRAKDNISSEILSLDELSTGTRVQLLLAIRLAFIHAFERGERLPVIADELLANSDDKRSDAIINSLIEISKERQVFYFTAQADEVAKWKDYLERSEDISSKIFILGDEKEEFDHYLPQYEPVVLIKEIPYPEGFLTRQQYYKLLDIPKFNIIEQEIEELHLGYLVEEPLLLYDLLRRGINRWGQLVSFRNNGGTLDRLDDNWATIEKKVDLLDQYMRFYRIGRPRRIERSVIEKSGVISATFLDPILELLEKEEFNPKQLLKSLPSVPRFRSEKIEELREYFLAEKIIDDKIPLSLDELNIRLQTIISSNGIDPEEAEAFIRSIFSGIIEESQIKKEADEPLLFSLISDD